MSRAAWNDLKRRTEFLERQTADAGYPFGGTYSAQDVEYERINAKITAVDSSSPANYSWTEQLFDTTGAYIDMPGGRSGTASVMPARERNGRVATSFPFYAELKSRVLVSGLPIYEFDLQGGGVGTGAVLIKVTSTTPSTTYGFYPATLWLFNTSTSTWYGGSFCWYTNPQGKAPEVNTFHLCEIVVNSITDSGHTGAVYADGLVTTDRSNEGVISLTDQFFGQGNKLADVFGSPYLNLYRSVDWPGMAVSDFAGQFFWQTLTLPSGAGSITGMSWTVNTGFAGAGAVWIFGQYAGSASDCFGGALNTFPMLFIQSPGGSAVYGCGSPSGGSFGGTGTVGWLQFTSGLLTGISANAGDILYSLGGTSVARLPIGSPGQKLTVSAGGLPVWA